MGQLWLCDAKSQLPHCGWLCVIVDSRKTDHVMAGESRKYVFIYYLAKGFKILPCKAMSCFLPHILAFHLHYEGILDHSANGNTLWAKHPGTALGK